MWSAEISAEYCALPASRLYARGDCFLYGYYNSNQHLIQVKICTAVDKEKGTAQNPQIKTSADLYDFLKSAEVSQERVT